MGIKLSIFISQLIEAGSKIVPPSTIQGYSNLLNKIVQRLHITHTLHIPHTPTHYIVIYFFETVIIMQPRLTWNCQSCFHILNDGITALYYYTTHSPPHCNSKHNARARESYILLTEDRDKENSTYIFLINDFCFVIDRIFGYGTRETKRCTMSPFVKKVNRDRKISEL